MGVSVGSGVGTGVGVVSGVGVFSMVGAGVASGSCVEPLAGEGVGSGVAIAVGSGVGEAIGVAVGSGVGVGLLLQALRTTATARTVRTAIQQIRRVDTVISFVFPHVRSCWNCRERDRQRRVRWRRCLSCDVGGCISGSGRNGLQRYGRVIRIEVRASAAVAGDHPVVGLGSIRVGVDVGHNLWAW